MIWIGLVVVILYKDEQSCKASSCRRICWQLKNAISGIVLCKHILGKNEDSYQRGNEKRDEFNYFVVIMIVILLNIYCRKKKIK